MVISGTKWEKVERSSAKQNELACEAKYQKVPGEAKTGVAGRRKL